MKLTKSTDFALRILIYLAKQKNFSTMPVISKKLDIPYNHLTKLVQNLSKSSLIHTKKGKTGGVQLLMPAKEISLKKVIDLIDGPTILSDCQKTPELCTLSKDCKLKTVFHHLQTKINTLMDDVKIAELV